MAEGGMSAEEMLSPPPPLLPLATFSSLESYPQGHETGELALPLTTYGSKGTGLGAMILV